MEKDNTESDWKLKLRYGKLKTPYQHFTLISQCIVGEKLEGFFCKPGNAFVGMKIWATSSDEAFDIMKDLSEHIGFSLIDRIQLYETEPVEPLDDTPHAYDITFTPFDAE